LLDGNRQDAKDFFSFFVRLAGKSKKLGKAAGSQMITTESKGSVQPEIAAK
jgi:hypothetical protein